MQHPAGDESADSPEPCVAVPHDEDAGLHAHASVAVQDGLEVCHASGLILQPVLDHSDWLRVRCSDICAPLL